MLIRCLDVETSGLDPAIHRVCEIATVDVIVMLPPVDHLPAISGEGDARIVPAIERGAMWSSLVNPERSIPPEASAIHDIIDEMVKDAPKISDVIDRVITNPDPDYYCAHNSRFDSKFFDQTVLRRPWLDTYRIALWLWPSAPEHKLATLRYWLKLNFSQTRSEIFALTARTDTVNSYYESESIKQERGHVAIWDACVCTAVLRRAFMAGATVKQMVEVSSQPALLPRFTFGKHAMQPIEEVPRGYLDWVLCQDMEEDVRHTAFAELQRRRNLERLSQG